MTLFQGAPLGQDAPLGIGLVGSGFMGRAHALAFRAAGGLFRLQRQPRLELLADRSEAEARQAASELGFARSTADWRALVGDPAVDIVAIATPNALHAPIALAAIANGKHVYCEKPLATGLDEAVAMAEAARQAGVVTLVGFNYLRNPMIRTAREIVRSGEIGTVTGFRGIHAEDFMADPEAAFSWRCEPAQDGGALADIGSHIVAMGRFLLGEVGSVCGRLDTIHHTRPAPDGAKAVEIDDQAAMLVRFADHDFTASLQASWLASGRTMQLAFELTGTRGAIAFTQERFNELQLYRAGASGRAHNGFTRIEAGPGHGDYGAFCPAPGHQLGFNDLKTIEVKHLLDAVSGETTSDMDFAAALAVTRVLDAVRRSSSEGRWIAVTA